MRRAMVIGQLSRRGIKDKKILDVFEKVPRHKFIDPKFHKEAYSDFPLPIGSGQTISQPYMVAFMAQLLDIEKSDSILEIGTGSGYQTAILAELAGRVFSIERIKDFTERSGAVLRELGYENITLKTDDGTLGWAEFSPFDKIIVSASAESVPGPLMKQLKSPGRLVMPIGQAVGQALLLAKKNHAGEIIEEHACGCIFVPLIGRYGRKDGYAGKDI